MPSALQQRRWADDKGILALALSRVAVLVEIAGFYTEQAGQVCSGKTLFCARMAVFNRAWVIAKSVMPSEAFI
ncbi:hypothetical protein [Janthinobacterium sp. B9-8]|uniref:hypothetical protein n=1 Tax=Janthinobacterium sp. B9-8 TaxID=1236179 RepID=UPI00061D1E6F|nr:hypothetical protein [Janthinobacterium sp. B9-8]AMC34636.1 hypothetical protein VN23_08465 [Janthinobacterium sp. B9-8]